MSLLIWTGFLTAISFLGSNASDSVTFTEVFVLYSYWYLLWALFSPVIMLGNFKLLESKPKTLTVIIWHLSGLLIFMLLYLMLGVGISLVVLGEVRGETDYVSALLETIKQNAWIFDMTLYLLVTIASYALHYFNVMQEKEKQNLLLQSKLYKTQLESLRSQLNPHFLFNALNTISGLTRMNDAARATDAVAELSYMLRIVLSEQSNTTISLEDEMIFIKKYVKFQKLRFGDKLLVNIDVDDKCLDVKVPFLLIHTIVENAVKHGSQLSSNDNLVDIVISEHGDTINICVENDICKSKMDDGFGIGLINCQQRLESYYKDDYKFESKELSAGRYLINITIPNREIINA